MKRLTEVYCIRVDPQLAMQLKEVARVKKTQVSKLIRALCMKGLDEVYEITGYVKGQTDCIEDDE